MKKCERWGNSSEVEDEALWIAGNNVVDSSKTDFLIGEFRQERKTTLRTRIQSVKINSSKAGKMHEVRSLRYRIKLHFQ